MKHAVATEQAIAQLARSIVSRNADQFRRSEQGDSPATFDSMMQAIEKEFRSSLQREIAKEKRRRQLVDDETLAELETDQSKALLPAGDVVTMDSPVAQTHDWPPSTLDGSGDSVATPPRDAQNAPADYEILGVLGKGGMGIVYKAWHAPLRRVVAVKMILAGAHASERSLTRFQQEAEAAARLSHPNIVSVHEVGHHNGMPFFSLEYVAGDSLSNHFRDSVASTDRAAQLMRQIAIAVEYSHQRGIVHRDLKPQNIMLTEDGVPKVTDFGLAKLMGEEGQEQTRTGEILGTPGYLAPEQAFGDKSVGPPADVHALGAMLYFLLTGRAPFIGTTPIETIRQVLNEEPVPPSKRQPKINVDLETICLKCLEKEPTKRYRSAQEFADEIDRVIRGEPIKARRVSRVERIWKWCKRNPKVATLSSLAAALLLTLLCGGYASAVVINRQKSSEIEARELAEDQAELAFGAAKLVVYQTQDFFKQRPAMNELRTEMLDTIISRIENLYAKREHFNVRGTFRASSLRQLGEILYEAGRYEQALEKFVESEQIALELHQRGELSRPDLNFGTLDLWIGDTQQKLGNLDLAEPRFVNMIDHRRRYFASRPDISETVVQQSMAMAFGRLGNLYRAQGNVREAFPLLQRSLDLRQDWYESSPNDLAAGEELSGAFMLLSKLYENEAEFPEMLEASKQSLNLLLRSAESKSDHSTIFNVAKAHRALGRQYQLVDDLANAESQLLKSTEQYELALRMAPDDGLTQSQAADSYYMLAKLMLRSGRDYRTAADRGSELCQQLLKKSANDSNRVLMLKLTAVSGQVEQATKLAADFEGDHRRADHCLYASIGYALASEHCQGKKRQELLDRAIENVRIAVEDLKFNQYAILRTDRDFAPLQSLRQYHEIIDRAEALADRK